MAGLLRRGKKKQKEEETTANEVEEMVETKEKSELDRFLKAENFRKLGQDVFNALPIMRQDPYFKFAWLGIILSWIRQWNQRYDEYTPKQLLVLEEMLQTELDAIREAYRRKIPKE